MAASDLARRALSRGRASTTTLLLAIWLASGVAHAEPAKEHLDAAAKAARSGNAHEAVLEYRRALAIARSKAALLGLADALQASGQPGEAYAAYDDAATEPTLAPAEKKRVLDALTKLARETGVLVLTADADAKVEVDGRPATGAVRVSPGQHLVVATKPGFDRLERHAEVLAGERAEVKLTLVPVATSGVVNVRERSGKPAEVIVDGQSRGPAPWSGPLPLGEHDVVLRSATRASRPQHVTVTRENAAEVVADAELVLGALGVTTSVPGAEIIVDGRSVGRGRVADRFPLGPHEIRIEAAGYRPETRTIEVTETGSADVRVELAKDRMTEEKPHPNGFYGALGLAASFQPIPLGDQGYKRCADLGNNCTTTSPSGGALLASFGRTFGDHFGLELLLGPQHESAEIRADDRAYELTRNGLFTAVRARGSMRFGRVRLTGAAGPGLGFRWVSVRYLGADQSTKYSSLAGTADASVAVKIVDGIEAELGTTLWLEDAGDSAVVSMPASRSSFYVASGLQAAILPHLGVGFGW